jgi:diaminopimelate decarboxylase
VAALADSLFRDGIELAAVDAGGGLGIEYRGGHAYDPAARLSDYAAALERALGGRSLRLLLEPGRFLVAQAGALVARVLYRKQNGAKQFLITDAGMNDLIRPALYGAHHEIVPVGRGGGEGAAARHVVMDVVGPVCETGDFFARDRAIPPVEAGDLVAVLDAGAYGMSLASNYNSRNRPAEVMVDGSRTKRVRRRETVKDQLRCEL